MNTLATLAASEGEAPLVPPWPEVLVHLLAFAILMGILAKTLVPKMSKVLKERRMAITEGIEHAEAARTEAEAALAQHREQLTEASHEAARLRQEAVEQSAVILADLQEEGRRQRESIIAAGHAQVAADRQSAAAALRQDAGRTTVELTRELVSEALRDEARQGRVIDRFLDELEQKAAKA